MKRVRLRLEDPKLARLVVVIVLLLLLVDQTLVVDDVRDNSMLEGMIGGWTGGAVGV